MTFSVPRQSYPHLQFQDRQLLHVKKTLSLVLSNFASRRLLFVCPHSVRCELAFIGTISKLPGVKKCQQKCRKENDTGNSEMVRVYLYNLYFTVLTQTLQYSCLGTFLNSYNFCCEHIYL